MSRVLTVLVVDDSRDERETWTRFVTALGHVTRSAASRDEALVLMEKTAVDVLLTDIHLTKEAAGENPQGIDLLAAVTRSHPNVTSLAMSSDPSTEIYEAATAAGALQFLRKPIQDKTDIEIALRIAIDRHRARVVQRRLAAPPGLPADLAAKYPDGVVISVKNLKVIKGMARNAHLPFTIFGETGTGKEQVAKLVWKERCAIEGTVPLIAVNCAHLNGDLALSMLFGHRKGAFSGASETTNGFIGDADGGILFLDEIQTLSISAQQQMLRVLNDGTYYRVGETKELTSRFQLIVASTKNLDEQVDAGRLLLDLRQRVSGIDILLPPLRDRQEDLPDLLRLAFAKLGVTLNPLLLNEFVTESQKFHWAGNIRQLFRVIESVVTLSTIFGTEISTGLLPFGDLTRNPGKETGRREYPSPACYGAIGLLEKSFADDVSLEVVMDAVEKAVIAATVMRHRTLGGAQEALQVSKTTLDAKRTKHGLKEPKE